MLATYSSQLRSEKFHSKPSRASSTFTAKSTQDNPSTKPLLQTYEKATVGSLSKRNALIKRVGDYRLEASAQTSTHPPARTPCSTDFVTHSIISQQQCLTNYAFWAADKPIKLRAFAKVSVFRCCYCMPEYKDQTNCLFQQTEPHDFAQIMPTVSYIRMCCLATQFFTQGLFIYGSNKHVN